ncbi:hypothetical protein P7H75_07340 [Vagococcus carniphilus]|uniref:DUF6608 family protein n=1 Tax=Vagococcus carniphilus TaxID=218144 RepID=UPI002890C271|nr:DUF6608 family protein [Vagococcus carniphilus]MDT2814656.1 hypothetical protein [Vagococcus carniphilus]
MRKKAIDFINGYCVIFTFVTIVSSIWQLAIGRVSDSNYHIINRAVITAIGMSIIFIEKYCTFKNKILNVIIPYVVSLSIVLIYTWSTGFVEKLHPNAYRDITLNFTALYIVLSIVIEISKRKSKTNPS